MKEIPNARELGLKVLLGIPQDVLGEVRTWGELLAGEARRLIGILKAGPGADPTRACSDLAEKIDKWREQREALERAMKVAPVSNIDGQFPAARPLTAPEIDEVARNSRNFLVDHLNLLKAIRASVPPHVAVAAEMAAGKVVSASIDASAASYAEGLKLLADAAMPPLGATVHVSALDGERVARFLETYGPAVIAALRSRRDD